MDKKPYWFPEVCDKAYCKRLREDYPEKASGMTDEELIAHYADGNKYATTWDHVGDAYQDYEPLADSFLAMKAALDGFIRCQCYNRATAGHGICKPCWIALNAASKTADGKRSKE